MKQLLDLAGQVADAAAGTPLREHRPGDRRRAAPGRGGLLVADGVSEGGTPPGYCPESRPGVRQPLLGQYGGGKPGQVATGRPS